MLQEPNACRLKISLRAKLLTTCRMFFASKEILEVDAPIMTQYASVDEHIDLFSCSINAKEKRFLISSPEYTLKRLLVEGSGDIYSISHVFRKSESGSRHQPEFTMAEWYRLGFSLEEMAQETLSFIQLFLDNPLPHPLTYSLEDLFLQKFQINPFYASNEELISILEQHHIPFYQGLEQESSDAIVNVILSELIEPCFPPQTPVILKDFLPSQAALAKLTKNGNGTVVARRFEIFYQGMELANGYDELDDAQELRERFKKANRKRLLHQKEALPIDELFLQSLENGSLPQCSGVAVGFDRLMMLHLKTRSISDVVSLSWELA